MTTNYKLSTHNKYAVNHLFGAFVILSRITKMVNSRVSASLKRSAFLQNKQPLGSNKTGNLNFPLSLQFLHYQTSFTSA